MGRDQLKDRSTPTFEHRRDTENAFVAFYLGEVGADSSINLILRNPSGSGVNVDVERFAIASTFEGQYTIHDEFSSTPATVGEDLDNLLMDSEGGPPDTGAARAEPGVSFTSTGDHWGAVLPSGGVGATGTGGDAAGTEPIMEPGREIVIELTNTSSEASNGSVGVVYSEERRA